MAKERMPMVKEQDVSRIRLRLEMANLSISSEAEYQRRASPQRQWCRLSLTNTRLWTAIASLISSRKVSTS